jgi:TRAP-type mannitol/chloroaromatic compound transport system substrate-binding protein
MEFLPATGGSKSNINDGFNDGSLYAAEFVNPCIDSTTIFDNLDDGVITHYYLDNWQSPMTLSFLMYRADLFDTPGLDFDRLRAAQQASLAASLPRLMSRQSECLAEIEAQGIQIHSLPTDVLDELQAATFVVLEGDAAENADVASVLDSMRLFVKANRRWFSDGPIDRDTRFTWPGYESDI